MIEEYKKLKEFPMYRIYNDGRVYSEWMGKFLRQSFDSVGYLQVTLSKGKKDRHTIKTHILVARAFIPNPNHYKEVNHIDCIKYHNYVSNLEWVNRSMNMKHASKYSYLHREELSPLTKEMVQLIPMLLYVGMSIKLIASLYKVGHITIRNIIQKKTWKQLNLIFPKCKHNKGIIYVSVTLYDTLKNFNVDNTVLNSRIKILESV